MVVYVVTSTSDYLELVECYNYLEDAQNRIIELACEDCGIYPASFEELEKQCPSHGTIDAMFIDMGSIEMPVYQIRECEVK